MAGTKLIAELPKILADLLDKTAEIKMVQRSAIVRMALKEYCERELDGK